MSEHVEPTLIAPTMLHDYPVELSPFAKRHREFEGLVELRGLRRRHGVRQRVLRAQRSRRPAGALRGAGRHAAAGDENAPPFDQDYIYALEHGMPPTGGIGIGIDRLVMLLTGGERSGNPSSSRR